MTTFFLFPAISLYPAMPTVILDSSGDFGLLVRACKLYKERQRGKTEKSLRQALEAKLYLASPPAGAVAVSSVSVAVAACDMPAILHLYSGQVARPWPEPFRPFQPF